MANVEVKNLKGSTTPACQCTTFLCHWENFCGSKARVCSKLYCSESNDLVGAHVIKCHGNAYATQYIVPLCKKHNNPENKDCFLLKDGVVLAPVTDRYKCKSCR